MTKLYIIKIGGNIIDEEEKLTSFLESFAAIKENKILIHGGGKVATKIGEKLGIESKYVDGRRITDADTIDLVTMVYAGLINKKIVAQLQKHSCNAFGVTGTDGNLISATKRQIIPPPSGDGGIDFGFVGDVDAINTDLLTSLLAKNISLVFAPITHDGDGQLLNTNADTIAQEIAKALSRFYEVQLIYSFEKNGVLLDISDDNTVMKTITPAIYKELKSPQPNGGGPKIFAGMIPKLDNAFAALASGVSKVIIGKAENLTDIIKGTSGTIITNE